MTKHLLKLVWNRKRSNLLIMLEITISFLVLFAVVTLGTFYIDNYRRPLGFHYDNVWNVAVDVKQQSDDTWTPEQVEHTRQLYLALRDMPEVEAAAGTLSVPYDVSGSFSQIDVMGRQVEFEQSEVTDGFADVFDLTLARGRWFTRDDDGAKITPVVVNQRLAGELFGAEDPIGKVVNEDRPDDAMRIVGVVSEFRKNGEFAAPANFLFNRANLDDPKTRPPRNLVLKLRPGTTAAFQEKLAGKLQSVAKEWSFTISPVVEMREAALKFVLIPVIVVGLVAGFLMIMVALGLMGVLWQNVTQRTREIGLRRVQGATSADICKQILGELLVVTTLALVVGSLVAIQLPLLDPTGWISTRVYIVSIAISMTLVYLLTIACGLYPSLLAMRVAPVQALRYE